MRFSPVSRCCLGSIRKSSIECSCKATESVMYCLISVNQYFLVSSLWAKNDITPSDLMWTSILLSSQSLTSVSGSRMISFNMNTDLSSDIRLTLQIKTLALNKNRYLSLDLPSRSITVHHSCANNRPSLWMLPESSLQLVHRAYLLFDWDNYPCNLRYSLGIYYRLPDGGHLASTQGPFVNRRRFRLSGLYILLIPKIKQEDFIVLNLAKKNIGALHSCKIFHLKNKSHSQMRHFPKNSFCFISYEKFRRFISQL